MRIDDIWVLEQPGKAGPTWTVSALPSWLGRVLTVLSSWELVDAARHSRLAELAKIDSASIPVCLSQLRRLGFLHESACLLEGERDTARARDYQFCSGSERPDYTDPSIVGDDIVQMNEWAREDPPPPAWRQNEGGEIIPLPVPGLATASGPHAQLGAFLYLSNAILADASIGDLPRSLRAVPSHGASHPFDMILQIPSVQNVDKPGTFAYDPHLHALVRLGDESVSNGEAGPSYALETVRIGIHLSIQRVQFRYRTSLAYQTIYLDLGHLLEGMTFAAEAANSTLSSPRLSVVPFTDRRYPGELLAEAFWQVEG